MASCECQKGREKKTKQRTILKQKQQKHTFATYKKTKKINKKDDKEKAFKRV